MTRRNENKQTRRTSMQDCPVCHKEQALNHPTYGVLPGATCQIRRRKNEVPTLPVEMVGESIKNGRKTHAKSALQPYRSGELSREYIEAYGTKNIKATAEEVKKAKYVWTDVHSRNFNIAKTK